jgi:hypothetical protein
MKSIVATILWTIVGWLFVAFILFALVFMPYRMITQMRMETWASYAGGLQARVWFQENHYRLLELTSITNLDFSPKFTGKNEGAFEIWTHPVYKDTNSNFLWIWMNKDDSDQKFVESFNRRRKQLWDEKQSSALPDSQSKTNSN